MANITIQGGSTNRIQGGGYFATVDNPNILVTKTETTEPHVVSIYGGMQGNGSSTQVMERSSVIVKAGSVSHLYGGGYASLLKDSNVTILGGSIGNLYGGSYAETMPANEATINVNVLAGTISRLVGGAYISKEEDALDNVQIDVNIGKDIAVKAIGNDVTHKAHVLSAAGVTDIANITTGKITIPNIYASKSLVLDSEGRADPEGEPITNYQFVGTTGDDAKQIVHIYGNGYYDDAITIAKTINGTGVWLENQSTTELHIKDWGEKYVSESDMGYIHTLFSIERFDILYIYD